jgi:hypothetical protein
MSLTVILDLPKKPLGPVGQGKRMAYTACMRCGLDTSHKSDLCPSCRTVACVRCKTVFITNFVGRARCGPCTTIWNKQADR